MISCFVLRQLKVGAFAKRCLNTVQNLDPPENHKVIGTFGDITNVEAEDKTFLAQPPLQEGGPEKKPLVVVFGWAGATHHNLSKYGDVYRDRGCETLQYILPTRFIFRHTEQVELGRKRVAHIDTHLRSMKLLMT